MRSWACILLIQKKTSGGWHRVAEKLGCLMLVKNCMKFKCWLMY